MKNKLKASSPNTSLTPELHTLSEGVKYIMETLWEIDEAAYVDKLPSWIMSCNWNSCTMDNDKTSDQSYGAGVVCHH